MTYRIIKESDGYLTMHEEYLKQLEKEVFTRGFEAAKKKAIDTVNEQTDRYKGCCYIAGDAEQWKGADFCSQHILEELSNIKED